MATESSKEEENERKKTARESNIHKLDRRIKSGGYIHFIPRHSKGFHFDILRCNFHVLQIYLQHLACEYFVRATFKRYDPSANVNESRTLNDGRRREEKKTFNKIN